MTMADTLLMLDRFREGGMPETQARSVAGEISRIITDVVATKADLRELRTELKSDIAQVRAELQGEIARVRNEIAEVKGEVAQVRGEVAQVRGEVARLESRMAEIATEIADLKTEVTSEIADLKVGIASEVAGLKNVLSDFKVSSTRWTLGTVAAIALGFAGIIVAIVLAA